MPGTIPTVSTDDPQLLAQALSEARHRLARLERRVQVDEALERVRERAMAMHRSDELADAAAAIFLELQLLGIHPRRCGFEILDDAQQTITSWHTTADGQVVRQPGMAGLAGHPLIEAMAAAWRSGEPLFTQELAGDDLAEYMRYLIDHTSLPLTEWRSQPWSSLPERLTISHFHFSHGALMIRTLEPLTPEEQGVALRFARVFDLTYRRYLDLKYAEKRALDSAKEASVDRVRAEIASMRTAKDLRHITPLIWRELTTLGVPFFRCGIFIIDEATQHLQAYLTTPEGQPLAVLNLSFDSAPLVQQTVEHWRARTVFTDDWDRAQFVAWMQQMIDKGQILAAEQYMGAEAPPESLRLHFVPFKQGMLYVGSVQALSADEIELTQTLADAFAVAYARYLDFDQLERKKREVETALSDLKSTQTQLIHAEKMASLGQMTAGIAHEIKNPLNFVNNFAELNVELAEELREVLPPDDEVNAILDDLKTNAEQIAKHGKRADAIVRAMMQHARGGSGQREPTTLNTLVDEYVNLAYHGMRASTPGFNATLVQELGDEVGKVSIFSQDIGRVVLNLLSNAFYAVHDRDRQDDTYQPEVRVTTTRQPGGVVIRVADNGMGIPDHVLERIFQPFFTTKPSGAGTGLGLSLSYDIVTKGHGGTMEVDSRPGEGATFIIFLPG